MHAECLRHIKSTVPNWEKIFEEVERAKQAAQQSEAAACKPDDATATAQENANSQTTRPASRGRTVKWIHPRPGLLTRSNRPQRPSESPSPLRLPASQPLRQDFWATVMGGTSSPTSSCGTGSGDSELEHLLRGNQASRDVTWSSTTERHESPSGIITHNFQKTTGDMNNTSADFTIHEDENASPIQAEDQTSQGALSQLNNENHQSDSSHGTHVQQQRRIPSPETNKTPKSSDDDSDQELDLDGYDAIACNLSDPWINYQNLLSLGGDHGATLTKKNGTSTSKLEDLIAEKIDDDPDLLQHTLSLALRVSGNSTVGSSPSRGSRRDGSESPSKKRRFQ